MTPLTLAAAILALAQLPNGQPIRPMRNHPLGPEGRSEQLAGMFVAAGEAHEIDPVVITALAWGESRFRSSAVSPIGAFSLMQLHPRGRWGRALRKYQALDAADQDRRAISLGTEALRDGVEACGTVPLALGWYRSGRCMAGRLVRDVLRTMGRLRASVAAA